MKIIAQGDPYIYEVEDAADACRLYRQEMSDALIAVVTFQTDHERLKIAHQEIAQLKAENEALRTQLRFVFDRIEDNAEAFDRDPTERGWRATFTYEETEALRCLIDPAFAEQVRLARVGAILERFNP
jgi:hypothetical protein